MVELKLKTLKLKTYKNKSEDEWFGIIKKQKNKCKWWIWGYLEDL